MSNALTEFIQTMVGGLSDMATGIGSGLNSAVTEMFLKTGEGGAITGLSTFGGVVAIFRTAFGDLRDVGLTSLVFHWVSNIGK